jgi:polar amino acid transport system substrate-binding protein
MDFTRPYLEIEMGYLVPAGSSLKSIDEIDRQGIRVAVTTNSTSDEVLTRSLKNASVVRANTLKIGLAWLAEGQAEAYATNKATLFEMADELPGAQVLKGYWGVERHAIAIPKGREAGLPVVQKFSEEVRASGLVAAAAKRAGLRGVLEAGSQ